MSYIYGNGTTFDKVDEIILVNSSEGVEDKQDFNEIITEEVPDINRYNLPNVKVGIIRNKVLSVEKKWIFKFYNARISTDISTVISDKQ